MMLLALLSVGGLFQDHMVLQRGRANAIWGTDHPAQLVTLSIEGLQPAPAEVSTRADQEGRWRLNCPPLPVGGPYRLRVKGSTERVIEDVLVGDVWLASGQSNMAVPLAGVTDSSREIAGAHFPGIRVAKVPQRTAATPQADVTVEWKIATPQNAAMFTAVGYFFARELHVSQGVPIGIIDSSWGGTRVEAWASESGLRATWPGIEQENAHLAAAAPRIAAIQAEYKAAADAWEKTAFPQDLENLGEAHGWARPEFDDRAWSDIQLPATVQSAGHLDNGIFWFRRELSLNAADEGSSLTLHLGAIDDHDRTYFNGELIGATGAETSNPHEALRHYVVPARLIRPGRNVIAVRVFDRFGLGGFMGPPNQLFAEFAGTRLPLDTTWKWHVERTIPKVPDTIFASMPPVPAEINFQNYPSTLFNAMIAPLVPYGLRGFIWYQGESNVGQHALYANHFTALIRDWRGRWGQGLLPFYFVQISAFSQNNLWPHLREAQSRVLSEPATGMAVSIDLGDPQDIHPKNKQDVGRRLALFARADTYGETSVVAHGPTMLNVEISGPEVRVAWRFASGLHTTDQSVLVKGFALAGADGVFHPAESRIDGEAVIVSSPAVGAPQHIRYAWADWLETNLANAAGLPAAPFRTDAF